MNKHSDTIRGLRLVTTCWSWAWSNRTSPSKWVGLGSPLAASSVYGDLTCCVHSVNNLCMFNCQCHFYLCNRGPYVRLAFVPNMLSSWNKDIIIIMESYTENMHFNLQIREWTDRAVHFSVSWLFIRQKMVFLWKNGRFSQLWYEKVWLRVK